MFFVLIGSIFFTFGWLLVLNFRGAAERTFMFYSRVNPTTGTATPKTLRILGGFWIPMGASAITIGLLK